MMLCHWRSYRDVIESSEIDVHKHFATFTDGGWVVVERSSPSIWHNQRQMDEMPI